MSGKKSVTSTELYEVAIVGGGVTGTAIAYALAEFTNVRRILLLEKNKDVALVNSHTASNAQTLHGGDTETNFTLEKALKMRDAEWILGNFLLRFGGGAFVRLYKMAFGVGAEEVEALRKRFSMIREYYPNLRFLEREEIRAIEPVLLEGRDLGESVAALYRENGFAVDYHKLAKCFVVEAKKTGKVDFVFGTKTKEIERKGDLYEIRTDKGVYYTRVVICAVGPYSLLFAHKLGAAKEYVILPVAGSFYYTYGLIKGKVYTVQDPKFPFAAPHADRSVDDAGIVRIGPTAKPLPFMERHHWLTFFDFMRTGLFTFSGMVALAALFLDWDMVKFVSRNMLYDLPFLGKKSFLKRAARKIFPRIKESDLVFAKDAGGIRPQLLNIKTRKLEMGTGKFFGDNAIFNITPSPGASDCLRNAAIDAEHIVAFLGKDQYSFDRQQFSRAFLHEPP